MSKKASKNKEPVKLARHIVDAITNGTICNMLKSRDTNDCVRTIDFGEESPKEDPYGYAYTVDVTANFPAKRDGVTCIFPNHRTEKRRVVKSDKYWYIDSLNGDMNGCLSESLDHTELGGMIKLAVAYGEQIYVCKNFTGTAYILWGTVNRKNPGNVPSSIFENQPLLYNLDGQAKIKAVFLLRPKVEHESNLTLLPVTYMNPVFMWPEKPVFVCESRPSKMEVRPLVTISKRMAKQRVMAQTKSAYTWLRFERNGLGEDYDSDVGNKLETMSEAEITDDASWAEATVSFDGDDLYTPRTGSNKPLKLHRMQSSPRVIRSRGSGPRNPFDSDNEEERQATVDEEEDLIKEQVGLDEHTTDIVIL